MGSGNFHKKKALLIVLDGVGIGEMPDAGQFDDEGSNTLGNLARVSGGFDFPNLEQMGLGNIDDLEGMKRVEHPIGSYGKMASKSPAKDSTTGHWELAGLIIEKAFPLYPNGFPDEVINKFKQITGKDILGNKPASGTEIIEELGEEHIRTGKLIVYTSGDSVFQIAVHKDIVPLEELYWVCEKAREILVGKHNVSRVIARPFVGEVGNFVRTHERKDFSVSPPGDTVLDKLKNSGFPVHGIGKPEDLFSGKGLTSSVHTVSNDDGITRTVEALHDMDEGFIITNLVDFDMKWGHRNNCPDFYEGLKQFDRRLPEVLEKISEHDLLLISSDHGNDPTTPSTDHSREYVPVLAYSPRRMEGLNLGTRETFADIGATIAEFFGVEGTGAGESFLKQVT